MRFDELFRDSFRSLSQPPAWGSILWRRCLSINSQFCKAVVDNGYLNFGQMLNAAVRYRLGATRQNGVIFWQIDHEERIRDGKVMYYGPDCHRDKLHHPTWVSSLLHRRDPFPNSPHETSHCFFGLHLLGHTENTEITEKLMPDNADRNNFCDFRDFCVTNNTVCVVEAEKTAVILSEHYPQCIWLAAGGLGEVQTDKFRPLRGHKVVMFPDTDPDGTAFKRWSEAAATVMQQPFWENSPPIRVSPILELNATPAQKSAKIDLVDYLFCHTETTDITEITPFNFLTSLTSLTSE